MGRSILTKSLVSVILLLSYNAEALLCNTQNVAIKPTTPTIDFIVNSNGTTTHIKTGLIWMRCGLGQTWTGSTCTGTPTFFLWGAALQTADQTNFANNSDWRLPNKNELESITELSCVSPAINLEVFPGTINATYWSSTQSVNFTMAWTIEFGEGTVASNLKDGNSRVRLVRGGL